ncbi:MAG: hypothetical protein ACI9N9_001915 [Enterobacterales bacterium]|jgi:hypothetical protein
MPKLSQHEIEVMTDEDLDEYIKAASNKRESTHKLEVKRRLDNYFEHKQLRKELSY